jgi:hypothetical protein
LTDISSRDTIIGTELKGNSGSDHSALPYSQYALFERETQMGGNIMYEVNKG